MELILGSNNFRNTNGVITLQGKEQIVIEAPAGPRQVFLTMDFYDANGKHVAHLRRNQWGFNEDERFKVSTSPNTLALFTGPAWVRVTDAASREIVIEIVVVDEGKVSIPQGKVYTHKGQLVEITPHLCRILGITTLFNDASDVRGRSVVLG